MITFKQFLAERRTEGMSMHDAQLWMQQHAMGYLKKGKFLYRGISSAATDEGILFANSTEGRPRKSVGDMVNYYTLWMSHHPAWKGLPRREHAFITSGLLVIAKDWGKPHLVVPADNSKVGCAKTGDIWNVKLSHDFHLANFTNQTRDILKYFVKYKGLQAGVSTYEDLRRAFKSISLADLIEARQENNEARFHITAAYLDEMHKHENVGTIFDLWETLITPDLFSFSDGKTISGKQDSEFWIEGSAIFIPLTITGLDGEPSEMVSWADDYAPKLAEELRQHWHIDGDDVERVDPDTVSARDTLTYKKKR